MSPVVAMLPAFFFLIQSGRFTISLIIIIILFLRKNIHGAVPVNKSLLYTLLGLFYMEIIFVVSISD